MGAIIEVEGLSYQIRGKPVLEEISFTVQSGSWLAVLGENGSGKTTLLDLLMGFKSPSRGMIRVLGQEPSRDPFHLRREIAYLSEKVDLPGDWSIGDFLEFNSRFYPSYDPARELELCQLLKLKRSNRVGNLSAGEIRRAQIAAALAFRPRLILIDEITAVLDIVGRRRLMGLLAEQVKAGGSVIFATNILEGLHSEVSEVLVLGRGKSLAAPGLKEAIQSKSEQAFCDAVVGALEG